MNNAHTQECWTTTPEMGFLMHPDPIRDLKSVDTSLSVEACETLHETANSLPELVSSGRLRAKLSALPVFEMTGLQDISDFRVTERAFQIYAHLANAYVWFDEADPAYRIPAGIAVPLVQLANLVERPPILPYASTSLCNFERIDPHGELVAENLRCIQELVGIPDESWFHVVHVEIEAHAAQALGACASAVEAISREDEPGIESALNKIPQSFNRMIAAFKKMARGCSPDVYFNTLRPYLFSFESVIYEGVEEFANEPRSFRGESGAQSSVIPALQAYLGIKHEQGGLTGHLNDMKSYMPRPHRELLNRVDPALIRGYVSSNGTSSLRDVYNDCLISMTEFRTLHLKMAHAFVAKKVSNPKGTGGTDFMHWLKQLRDETEQQLL